jgi:hypothetical protein
MPPRAPVTASIREAGQLDVGGIATAVIDTAAPDHVIAPRLGRRS